MPINTIHQEGDNEQLRKVIFDATPLAIQQTKSIARQFQGKTEIDTCKNIFDYLLNKITYRADGHHQQVKLPSALLRERVGDCKSYSVFTYAILTNLGISCKYVLTSYSDNPSPSHIYVMTDSGIIIDAVWGKFNSEKQPTYRYLKKIEDMKISTITGINANKSVQIGSSCCSSKGIAGWTAEQWYDNFKGKDGKQGLVSSGDKATHIAAILPAKPMRLLMLEFIKANGGGIATSIWNKVFRAKGTITPIPQSEKNAIEQKYKSNALKYGVKIPTETQRNNIKNLQGLTIVGYEGTGIKRKPIFKAKMDLKTAFDQVMGAGQYDLYSKYYAPLYTELGNLEAKYTLGDVKESDIKIYQEFEKSWYRFGGTPQDVIDAVAQGKDKRPKGKDANYMLMVSKTRGLKVKDLGLIIRGFVSAFGGEQFDWGSDKTYMFGTSKNKFGIGEVTVATVTAWISAISALLALISKIFTFVESRKDLSKAEDEMKKLETDGYIIEQDYYSLPIPRKRVIEIKQISVPTAEAPSLEEIGSAVEFFAGFFPSDSTKTSTTPPTLAEFEKKQKEGSLPPYLSQEVDNAKKDKYTLEALQKASQLTGKLVPASGETIVTYYKLGTDVDDSKGAGFGGIILPLLIGVGALIALNTKKK